MGMIPGRTLFSLNRYVRYGVPTGGFLEAVLSNNLMESIARADEENLADLSNICKYIHWELPSQCHGSPEKVKAWLDQDWTEARKEIQAGSSSEDVKI